MMSAAEPVRCTAVPLGDLPAEEAARVEMDAFDSLPPAVRARLTRMVCNVVSPDVAAFLARGGSERAVLEALEIMDATSAQSWRRTVAEAVRR
jgi:hypothetical protein